MSVYVADSTTGEVTLYDDAGTVLAVSPPAPDGAGGGYSLCPPPVSGTTDGAGNLIVPTGVGGSYGTSPGAPVPLWATIDPQLTGWTAGPPVDPTSYDPSGAYTYAGVTYAAGQLWVSLAGNTQPAALIPVDMTTGALGAAVPMSVSGSPITTLAAAGGVPLYLDQYQLRRVINGTDYPLVDFAASFSFLDPGGSLGGLAVDGRGNVWVTGGSGASNTGTSYMFYTGPDVGTTISDPNAAVQVEQVTSFPSGADWQGYTRSPYFLDTGVFTGDTYYMGSGGDQQLTVFSFTVTGRSGDLVTGTLANPLWSNQEHYSTNDAAYVIGAGTGILVPPPLRQYPRSDSLGVGGSRRPFTLSRTLQGSIRQGWHGVTR